MADGETAGVFFITSGGNDKILGVGDACSPGLAVNCSYKIAGANRVFSTNWS